MGNLLGEGFPEEIIKQVEQRQKIYGEGYANGSTRSLNTLKYLNTNTSWCKLVSSVDITNQEILVNKSLQTLSNIGGSELARKFVLFNGVQSYNKLREGIDFGDNILSEKAYGIGGNEFGPRPMMGIKSANIKHLNRGSIRTATVQIKAWNKIQFDIIDALYLRLGFNILLEWGHVSYFDNKGEYQENIDNSLEELFLTGTYKGKDLNYSSFLKLIEKQRLQTFGNYDAMFAKVSNMHWSFLKDGSYDITLDLVSVGDVIESFKVNALNPNTIAPISPASSPNPPVDLSDTPIEQLVTLLSNQNTINQYFTQMLNQMRSINAIVYQLKSGVVISNKYITNFAFNQSKYNNTGGFIDGITEVTSHGEYFYCRLGNFLEFIQNNILYQIGSQNSLFPLMKIDTQIESNLMYVNPIQISTDPTVCVVNKTLKVNDLKTSSQKDLKFTSVGENFISSFKPPSNSEYGQIMNIYVNVRFIIVKMNELKDEKGNLSLIDFLKGILAGINGALGGINELDVFIDEVTNTIKIIDKNPMPDIQWLMEHINDLNVDIKLNTKYATFELYGYNTITNEDKTITNTAGFIKDFNFKTELSPAMSTMITVGATANGTVVGENATALSRLNNGYTDRFKPFITDNTSVLTPLSALSPLPQFINTNGFKVGNLWEGVDTGRSLPTPPPPAPNTAKDIYEKIGTEYLIFYNNFIGYLERLSTWKFTFEEISTYKDALVNFNKAYAVYKKAKEDYLLVLNNQDPVKNETMQPSTGFIPFNLSLTMDGMSGMKVNSKFLIDTSYLPSNYPNTVDFLIKGLSHKIEGNKWETMLESYCISKGEYKEAPEKNINPKGQQSTQQSSQSPQSTQSPQTPQTPNKAGMIKTLNSNFDLNKYIISGVTDKGQWNINGTPKIFKKTQIYIHHTAGWARSDQGKGAINDWNRRAVTSSFTNTWATGAPYIMDKDGWVEQLADDRYFYITQGSKFANNTNQIGIGIEISNPGPATLKNGDWYALGGNISKNKTYGLINGVNGTTPLGIGNGISYLVDENGTPITYNTHKYGVSYFPAQIIELEKLLRKLMATHGIPFKWEGKSTYEQMFPNYPASDPRYKNLNGNKSVPGIYTHRVADPTQKIDSLPTKELIEMLKRFK